MSLTKQQVTALYIAVYNRAPDAAGLTYWTTEFEGTYADAAAGFVAHPLFAAEYQDLTNQEKVEKFYTNILGAEGDTDGIEYWVARLDADEDINVVLSEFLNISLTGDFSDDAAAQARQDTLLNKVEVGLYYVAKLGDDTNMSDEYDANSVDVINDPAFKAAQKAIAGVDNTQASVDAAIAAIDNQYGDLTGELFFLTEGADRDTTQADGFLKGTDGNDKFIADIVQNQFGQQVNTLGTGDRLDGGEGNDTLEAQVTAGAFAGSSSNMAIQARTKNIENLKFEAVNSSAASGYSEDGSGWGDQVYVNAKDMTEVNYIGSERSNASLTIQDLTSKGVAGGTKNMTVGMKYTGNADSQWNESDFKVLFDQDYLKLESDTQNGWVYEIMNQKSWDATNGTEPVKGFPLERITFTLERENMPNQKISLDFTAEDRKDLVTQQDLVDALNAKLAEEDLTGLTFELNGTFSDPDGRTSQSINLVNTNEDQKVIKGTVGLDEDSSAGNLFWNNESLDDVVQYNPVAINVELEKVGRAGDGGELVIGSMNKVGDNSWSDTDNNVWDAVNTVGVGTVSGVQVFNVTVDGGKAESSSLAGMRSTNNNLREVNVVSADGSNANLTIGNDNTAGDLGTLGNAAALKDVQTFDASGFNGDLEIHAALTDEITAKYMDLKDNQPNPADDNFAFNYTGGKGNDTIDLVLSAANLADAGTTTREDFSLTVDGGDGDDTIIVSIQDNNGGLASTSANWHWYANSKMNANLNIKGGDGNDTVYINGGGDWKVNLGAGNDVIYAGNSGNPEFDADSSLANQGTVWVLNTADQSAPLANGVRELDDLQSGVINTYAGIYKSTISVSFKQGDGTYSSKKVEVPTDNKYNATDLHINQAIKEAINADSVLGKLLVAEDGPGGTLIVTTLIDGVRSATAVSDLTINWAPPSAADLNATDVSTFNAATGSTIANAGALAGSVGTAISGATQFVTDYTAAYATDGSSNEYSGSNSAFASDNEITGGTGNDVIVLGTAVNSNDTVKYEDFDNGKDTIINFTEGAVAGDFGNIGTPGALGTNVDFIDLSSYKAEYVDFGSYTTNVWSDTDVSSSDIGTTAVLSQNDVFLRVNDSGTGVYTVEAWKVTATGTTDVQVAPNTDIEKLGTVGTLDFGFDVAFDAHNFMI